MRLAVSFATLVGLIAMPAVASACPPADACLAKLRAGLHEPLKPIESAEPAPVAVAVRSLQVPRAPRKLTVDGVEMPWIWAALRERAYSQLPTYRDRNALRVVLAPFVVTSPSDTIPALGISGAF